MSYIAKDDEFHANDMTCIPLALLSEPKICDTPIFLPRPSLNADAIKRIPIIMSTGPLRHRQQRHPVQHWIQLPRAFRQHGGQYVDFVNVHPRAIRFIQYNSGRCSKYTSSRRHACMQVEPALMQRQSSARSRSSMWTTSQSFALAFLYVPIEVLVFLGKTNMCDSEWERTSQKPQPPLPAPFPIVSATYEHHELSRYESIQYMSMFMYWVNLLLPHPKNVPHQLY
jgi:hypothetical protein